jgi:hypothetical protein
MLYVVQVQFGLVVGYQGIAVMLCSLEVIFNMAMAWP